MAANYATLDEAKAQRDLTANDTAADDLLNRLITVASRKIDHHCNVTPGAFAAQTQTRYYTAKNSHCLVVDNLLSLSTSSGILTDDAYDNTYSGTWATTSYRLYPYNAALDGVPYREIRTIATASNSFPVDEYEPRVRVTGSFGYATRSQRGVPAPHRPLLRPQGQ
jgi:hypothetical protein